MNRAKILSLLPVLALAACASLHSPPAEAGTATITWTNPTTNTDNSAIDPTQGQPESLQTWRIEYGTCNADGSFGTKVNEFSRTRATGGQPLTSAVQNVPAVKTCFRVFVANFAGKESDASNVAVDIVPPSTPNHVTNAAGS